MNEALQSLNEVLSNLRSLDHVVVLLVALMVLGFFIAWNADPWRTLVAWLATTSIQFEAGSIHLSLSDLFFVPLVMGAFMTWLRSRDKQVRIPSALLAFTLLFLTAGNIVTALSLGKLPQWTWLNKDLGLIELLLCYWSILVICRTQALTESAVRAFVSSVSIINLAGLFLYVGSLLTGLESIVNYDGMRFKGLMLDPNGYAGLAAVAATLQFAMLTLKRKSGLGGTLQLVNLALLATGCILTLSRGGFIALLAGVMMLLYFTKTRSARIMVFALIAIPFAVLWLSSRTDLDSSIQRRTDDRGNIESRIDYIEQGMRMYLASPVTLLTGIGIGTFIEDSPQFFGDKHQIHNTYVWLLVEGGPFLLSAYLFVLYRALRQNYWVLGHVPDLRYAAVGCFCGLITVIVWCMGIEGAYHHHVWVLLAFSELLWSHSVTHTSTRQFEVRAVRPMPESYAAALPQ
jgi:O-antigen ligase